MSEFEFCAVKLPRIPGNRTCRKCGYVRWSDPNPSLYAHCLLEGQRKAAKDADLERWRRLGASDASADSQPGRT